MTVFAGVDLAWSGRNPSGRCVLRAAGSRPQVEVLDRATLDAAAVADWLDSLGDDVVAGIDAPLIAGESRAAEGAMARVYGRQGVFAYAARPRFLRRHGIAEGPALGAALVRCGWNLAPGALARSGRHALEVFPHAITVSLLGAPRALCYKRGRLAERRLALGAYRQLIRAYVTAECPRLTETLPGAVLDELPLPATGGTLKDLEDRLDALVCALAARHLWVHGAAGTQTFGDTRSGYIVVPVRPAGSQ